jgi:hypothetical protein
VGHGGIVQYTQSVATRIHPAVGRRSRNRLKVHRYRERYFPFGNIFRRYFISSATSLPGKASPAPITTCSHRKPPNAFSTSAQDFQRTQSTNTLPLASTTSSLHLIVFQDWTRSLLSYRKLISSKFPVPSRLLVCLNKSNNQCLRSGMCMADTLYRNASAQMGKVWIDASH